MFVKGKHERQFAYEAHTACDRHGFVPAVEVTAGNVSDSVAWDAVYKQVRERFEESKFIVMDVRYKTPWIAKKTLDGGRIPILIWQEYLDLIEALRKTGRGKKLYAMRKAPIERIFGDAKEKHAMRYTHHRGLARVTNWVRLKFAAINLKMLANWCWEHPFFRLFLSLLPQFASSNLCFA